MILCLVDQMHVVYFGIYRCIFTTVPANHWFLFVSPWRENLIANSWTFQRSLRLSRESFMLTIILSIRKTMTECITTLLVGFRQVFCNKTSKSKNLSYPVGNAGTKSYQMMIWCLIVVSLGVPGSGLINQSVYQVNQCWLFKSSWTASTNANECSISVH